MANFNYYTQFILKGNEFDSSLLHNFYPVTKAKISESESRLGFDLPKQLVEFYEQIGFGFMFTDKPNTLNTLLHPSTVADIFLREEPFESDPDLEIYDDPTQIIFYQVNEGVFITMDISNDLSNIYYFTAVIADSLEDFMNKLEKNSTYFEEFKI